MMKMGLLLLLCFYGEALSLEEFTNQPSFGFSTIPDTPIRLCPHAVALAAAFLPR